MSRLANIAAPIALTLLTATQALAATFGSIGAPVSQLPHLQISCYTRIHTTATNSQFVARRCNAGERPGSVTDIYVG